jgi:hypothetical protein
MEKTHHKKRAGRVAQGVGAEFKPQYRQKKKKKKSFNNLAKVPTKKVIDFEPMADSANLLFCLLRKYMF